MPARPATFEQIMEASLQLGGTITSEHGVGPLKADALRLELRKHNLQLQRDIKRVFDPANLLKPGSLW